MKPSFKYAILLILIFLIFIGNIVYWQSQNKAYFDYDSLRHYMTSIQLFDDYKLGFNGLASRIGIYLDTGKHLPGAPFVSSLLYFLINPTQKNAVLINDAVFLIILLFSLFNLGRLVQDRKLGLLSCITVLLYPIVFNQAKIYMLDLPLLSLTVLNSYLIIKTEYFKDRKYTILYIISFFCGMMIKLNFLFFTTGPLLYVIFRSFKSREIKLKYFLTMGIVFIILSVVYFFALPVYDKNLFMGLTGNQVATWTSRDMAAVPFLIHKIRAIFWYVWGFINWQGGFLFFILFLWGLTKFIKSNASHKKIIIAWLFSSYFMLIWFLYAMDFDMEVTGVRYAMPLLGVIALVTSYGLLNIGKVILRRIAILSVLIFGTVNTAFLSFPILKDPFVLKLDIPQDRYHILPSYINIFSTKPLIISGSSWISHPQDKGMLYKEIEDVFFFINKFYKDKEIKVILLSDNAVWWHLKYLAYMHNRGVTFFCDYAMLIRQFKGYAGANAVKEADFAIELKNEFTEPYLGKSNRAFKKLFEKEKTKFYLIKEGAFYRLLKRS